MEENQEVIYVEQPQSELTINSVTRTYLAEIYKWSKFFVIMGIIGAAIMVLAGISMIFVGLMSGYAMLTGAYPAMGIFYIILSGLYIPSIVFLSRFSNSLKMAVEYSDNNEVEPAFLNLKSLFKYNGIMIIVMIAVYILAIIGFVLFMVSGMI